MSRHRPLQHIITVLLLVLSFFSAGLVLAHDRQQERERERVVVFGDSLSDPGNAFVLTMTVALPPFELIPAAPYARGGLRFTNGPTWVEQLAGELDAERSAGPALRKPLVFSNYAVGGARARPEGPFNLGTQVNIFLRDFSGVAPADALYVVFFGGNDVRDALAALAFDASGATSSAILQGALAAVQDNLLRLYAAGARDILVANAPDLSLVPAVRLQGPAVQSAARFLAASYNTNLNALLDGLQAASGAPTARLDVFAVLNAVVATPQAFGFTEVEQPCITPGTTVQPYCKRPDQYLFWDGIHPTSAGHQVLANKAYQLVNGNQGKCAEGGRGRCVAGLPETY